MTKEKEITQETEEAEETEEIEKTQKIPSFKDLLKKFVGAPDQMQIDTWKTTYGDVFCSAFSEVELFIWRSLNRQEWREHQIEMAKEEGQVDPFIMEEQTVRQCLLWTSPSGEKALQQKAGTLSTLHEQLLQNSNFVDPRLASNLVVKL